MAIDWEKIGPGTPVSELTVGDLLDIIGWALTNYKAGEQGDVQGFAFQGYKPAVPALSALWRDWQPQYWARGSAGLRRPGQTGLAGLR